MIANVSLYSCLIQSTSNTEFRPAPGFSEREKSLLRCLNTFDTHYYKTKILPKRIHHACLWISENQKFRSWASSKFSTLLWLTADPGCGKTILASYIVDSLSSNLSNSAGNRACYFFSVAQISKQMQLTLSPQCDSNYIRIPPTFQVTSCKSTMR